LFRGILVRRKRTPSPSETFASRYNVKLFIKDKIKNAHTLSFFIFSNAGPLDPWSEENYEALQEKSGDGENGPVGPPVLSEEPHGSDELFEPDLIILKFINLHLTIYRAGRNSQ
jgi:hypothetical protein